MLRSFRSFGLYAALVVLGYSLFLWSGLRGWRWLGDDNDSTENINGTGGHSSGSHGRATYFHK